MAISSNGVYFERRLIGWEFRLVGKKTLLEILNSMKLFFPLCFVTLVSCITYSAGNIGSICDVETNLRLETIRQFSDSLYAKGRFNVPPQLAKTIDIDTSDFLHPRVYYLDDFPKQVYVATLNGNLTIIYIYDLNMGAWINREAKFTDEQREALADRFRKTVLKAVETEAKRNGYPDSLLYFE